MLAEITRWLWLLHTQRLQLLAQPELKCYLQTEALVLYLMLIMQVSPSSAKGQT